MKTCKMGCGKMKSGGAATKPIKKMKTGGIAKDNATLKSIINRNGVPYSGTTGAISMKKGGFKKSLVKAETGMTTKSSTPDPNPSGKTKFGELISGILGGGAIAAASSYFNSDKAAARQKARLEKREARKGARQERQIAKAVAKSKKRQDMGFKGNSSQSFKKGGTTKNK